MTQRQKAIDTAQQLVTRCNDAIADFAHSRDIGTHFLDYRQQAHAFLDVARRRTTGERMLSVMLGDMRKLSERITWTYERATGGDIHGPVTPMGGLLARRFTFGGAR